MNKNICFAGIVLLLCSGVLSQQCYAPPAGEGQSCLMNDCQPGLRCNGNDVCVAYADVGEDCSSTGSDYACVSGSYCDGTRCLEEAKEGEACIYYYECQYGLGCAVGFGQAAGTCQPSASVAAGDAAAFQSQCEYPLLLDTTVLDSNGMGICKEAADVTCVSQSDCYGLTNLPNSMFSCSAGRCQFLGPTNCGGKYKSWVQADKGKPRNTGCKDVSYDDSSEECAFEKCIFADVIAKGHKIEPCPSGCVNGGSCGSQTNWNDVNGACGSVSDRCKIGLVCDDNNVCQDIPSTVGASCGNGIDSCAEGLYCDSITDKCQEYKKSGETCAFDYECVTAYYCSSGKCTLAATVTDGGIVSNENLCAYTLFPVYNSGTGMYTCTDPSKVSCTLQSDCANDNVDDRFFCCNGGKCEWNGNNCKSQYTSALQLGKDKARNDPSLYKPNYGESQYCAWSSCLYKEYFVKGCYACGSNSGSQLTLPLSLFITLVIAIFHFI